MRLKKNLNETNIMAFLCGADKISSNELKILWSQTQRLIQNQEKHLFKYIVNGVQIQLHVKMLD